ncbi:hypothetical protein AB0C71_16980 [Streptomyces anulatus]|uniref:hypothetical protein n=1 Tax=Streptomyces TaxID=1883 RepID=UPI0015CF6EF6|nr:hypothetical protein [Streptomyces sp. or20]
MQTLPVIDHEPLAVEQLVDDPGDLVRWSVVLPISGSMIATPHFPGAPNNRHAAFTWNAAYTS